MAKIFLSFTYTAEKDPTTGEPHPDKIAYIHNIARFLENDGHDVWHSLQPGSHGPKSLIDAAFEKSFATDQGYTLGMAKIHELIQEFREGEPLHMIAVGKIGPGGKLMHSTGMEMELAYYCDPSQDTTIYTLYPEAAKKEMKAYITASTYSKEYIGNINETGLLHKLIQGIKKKIN